MNIAIRAKIIISFSFLTIFSLHATRIYQKSLPEFIQDYPATNFLQCTHNYAFEHNTFPLYSHVSQKLFPPAGYHADIFIFQVLQATAYFDQSNYVFINNCFLQETQIRDLNFFQNQKYIDQEINPINVKVHGTVAIIFHLYPSCYAHWMLDIFSQLAMLELNKIAYDYLCIPYYEKFMQESLDLWHIDRKKIIPLQQGMHIQADAIIMMTSVSRADVIASCSNYYVDFLLRYTRNKLLNGVKSLNLKQQFAEKIFISRKDAGGKRAIPNEDEVFELFKPLGFVRYELRGLSVAEKIALFAQAKTIVSFVGSGSTNIIFCQPGTHYIEITQKMVEASYFFIADSFNLQYSSIDDSTCYDLYYGLPSSPAAALSLDRVKEFISQHPDL
jgi:hypothetical protein